MAHALTTTAVRSRSQRPRIHVIEATRCGVMAWLASNTKRPTPPCHPQRDPPPQSISMTKQILAGLAGLARAIVSVRPILFSLVVAIGVEPATAQATGTDRAIPDATPMRVLTAQHRAWLSPALRGTTSVVTKLGISTTGDQQPLSVTRLQVQFDDDCDLDGIKAVHALGQQQAAARTLVMQGAQVLANGNNELTIAVDLSERADLSKRIAASITSITLSNGKTLQPDGQGTAQRIGVA